MYVFQVNITQDYIQVYTNQFHHLTLSVHFAAELMNMSLFRALILV